MRPFALAALLTLSAPAAAGGNTDRNAQLAPMPLFIGLGMGGSRLIGPTTSYTIDVVLSRRQKPYSQGAPSILLTVVQPDGHPFVLDSRPLVPGEKLHWEGKIPANGTYVLRVVGGGQNSASYGPLHGPLKVVVTGDEKGNWGVSDGNCPPRVIGSCGGPAPK